MFRENKSDEKSPLAKNQAISYKLGRNKHGFALITPHKYF